MAFKLTANQMTAIDAITADENALFVTLAGGARSGKTALAIWIICVRCLLAPGSRHLICRETLNSLRFSVCFDTFPKIMALAFPGIGYELSRTDWVCRFPNGSSIYFLGLDSTDASQRVLGQEFATVLLNEVSQIKRETRDLILSRLAQLVAVPSTGRDLELLCLADLNPVGKSFWLYQHAVAGRDSETKLPLSPAERAKYLTLYLQPEGNRENISPTFFDMMASASARHRKRYLEGAWQDETPGQLFVETDIDRMRVVPGEPLPEMRRVVIGVDPSGGSGGPDDRSDAVGIVVCGLGWDNKLYVLADYTVQGVGPAKWAQTVINAFDRHGANTIVVEMNYGGALCIETIRVAAPGRMIPIKGVTSSRGKALRAEPIAALYEQGVVRHAEIFGPLEDELYGFSSTLGWTGSHSPGRADALVFALTELYPAAMRKPYEAPPMSPALIRALNAPNEWSA